MKNIGRWFVAYWPYYCSAPANGVFIGDIEEIIKALQGNDYTFKKKILGTFHSGGAVIFFHKLS